MPSADVRARKSPPEPRTLGPATPLFVDQAGGHNFKPLDLLDDDDDDDEEAHPDARSTFRRSTVPIYEETRVKRTTATLARARRIRFAYVTWQIYDSPPWNLFYPRSAAGAGVLARN